jgi:myo-inositol 2-dehydrogenase / D-chiro-inositol 1-dehydrogenase
VHNLDVCNWLMNTHPIKCWGMGARQMLGRLSGEIWDNFAIEYEYPAGVRLSSYCGQIRRSWSSISEYVYGIKGNSNPAETILVKGEKPWRARGLKLESADPFVQEHVDLLKAIVNNTELNEARNGADSTLTAIMGREAAYSGGPVEWDPILNNRFGYGPVQVYLDASKMSFGEFRTLPPPLPSQHDVLSNPPVVAGA